MAKTSEKNGTNRKDNPHSLTMLNFLLSSHSDGILFGGFRICRRLVHTFLMSIIPTKVKLISILHQYLLASSLIV